MWTNSHKRVPPKSRTHATLKLSRCDKNVMLLFIICLEVQLNMQFFYLQKINFKSTSYVLWILIVGFLAILPKSLLANTELNVDQPENSRVLYFFPNHKNLKDALFTEFDILKQIPASAWTLAEKNNDHYGLKNKKIFIKMNTDHFTKNNVLAIEDRHLTEIKVQAVNKENDSQVILNPTMSVGFRSARFYSIPQETTNIYIIAQTSGAMIMPYKFINKSQADLWLLSSVWSLGIFFGIAFISLLICSFQYLVLKQKSLGLVSFLVISISLYIISKSNLSYITDFPIHYFNHPGAQVILLSLIAISALYAQFFSDDHLVSKEPSTTLSKLFKAAFILILTPLLGYIFVQNEHFRLSAFQIIHLPSLVLAFIIAAIASSLSHKRNLEQGYLLLTWLFLGASMIIEGGEFLGMSYSLLLPLENLISLPGIFYSISLIFLSFWSMNHSSMVQKLRTEAIQNLFDGMTEKNRALEINYARTSDMAQEIYKDIREPTKHIIQIINSEYAHLPDDNELTTHLVPLEKSLRKLMLLGQDLQQSISAQNVPFKLPTLFNRILLSFKQRATDQNVQINLDIDESLPTYASGDQALLLKTLLLIAEHRLQDLSHGTIRIYVSRSNDPRSPQIHLKIRIEDSGVPFNKESLNELWSHSPTLGSHDFQLLLARDMVLAMGGEFTVYHDPVAGNCFYLQVILERTHNPQDTLSSSNNSSKEIAINFTATKQALLFQEFNTTPPTLSTHLKELKVKVHKADTSQEAASTVIIEKPNFIFFEVNTHEELTTAIKNIKHIAHSNNIPLICISKEQSLKQHCNAAGITYFIHSPPTIDALIEVIAEHL